MCSWESTLQNTTGVNVNFMVLYVKFGEIFEKLTQSREIVL